MLRAFGDVLPVDEDATVLDVGQAQQQFRERGFARSAQAYQTYSLTCGDMQVEILEHRGFRIAVGVVEADPLEIDGAVTYHHVRRAVQVGHKPGFVKGLRHPAGIAEGTVEALQAVVDEVELVRDGVGVGEHHHERAGADAVPCVSAGDEHGHHAHDDHGDGCGDDAAGQTRPHALAVAFHHLAVRLIEQRALVVLAPRGLHGKDVRHRIGKLTGELVLRAGGFLVQRKDSLVHVVRNASVHDQQCHEDGHVYRHARRQNGAREYHRADHRQKREGDGFEQQLVGAHELARLAYQRAAEPVRMEAHGLVAQRVEAHGGKVVGRSDLKLVHGVILKLAGCLPEHVDGDERRDIGAVDRKHLVGLHASGAHAIDDQAHHIRVAVR